MHENTVKEIESLKRELMLLSEKYEKLFRIHENYKEEVKGRVGKLEKSYEVMGREYEEDKMNMDKEMKEDKDKIRELKRRA